MAEFLGTMSDTAALSIVLDATMTKFEADMKRAASVVTKSLSDIGGVGVRPLEQTSKALNDVQKGMEDTAKSAGTLRNAIKLISEGGSLKDVFELPGLARVGAIATAGMVAFRGLRDSLTAIVEAGDQASAALSRLNIATGGPITAADTFQRLSEISRSTGTSVDELAGAFTRFAIAARAVGATNSDILKLTELMAKLGTISGAGPQEAAAAIQQLGQALASGRLQGDELRSIMENMPLLAEGLARQLNVSVGRLREMGTEGKLTADVVLPAILRLSGDINAQFNSMPLTFSRAMSQLSSAWTGLLAQIDRAIQLSRTLAAIVAAVGSGVEGVRRALGGEVSQQQQTQEAAARVASAARDLNQATAELRRAQAADAGRDPRELAVEEQLRRTNNLGGAPLQGDTTALQRQVAERQRIFDEAVAAEENIRRQAGIRAAVEADDAARRREEAARAQGQTDIAALEDRLNTQRALYRKFEEDLARLRAATASGAITPAGAASLERDLRTRLQRELEEARKHDAGPAPQQTAEQREAAREAQRQADDLQRRLNAVRADTQTPIEKFESQLRDLARLSQATMGFQGWGGLETNRRAILDYAEDAAKALRQLGSEGTAGLRQLQDQLTAMGPTLLANGSIQSLEQWAQQVQATLRRAQGAAGNNPTDFWSSLQHTLGGRNANLPEGVLTGQLVGQGIQSTVKDLGSALTDIADGSKTAGEAFKNFGVSVLKTLAQIAAQIAAMQLIKGILGAFGLSTGGATGSIPGRASGGPVSAGRMYLVGERGPELFSPSVAGRIIPDAMGGGGGGGGDLHVTVQNNAPGVVVTPQRVDERTVAIAVDMARHQVAQDYAESMRTGYGSYSEPAQRNLAVRRRI
jgi:tape measure domain-containing protein